MILIASLKASQTL